MGVFIATGLYTSYGESAPPATTEQEARIHWVEKCLVDFGRIRVGMTRSDVDKIFPQDGGIQCVSPVRYIHPECGYFMIDVSFDFKRNPDDQNRAITSPDDLVTNISRPYIEYPAYD